MSADSLALIRIWFRNGRTTLTSLEPVVGGLAFTSGSARSGNSILCSTVHHLVSSVILFYSQQGYLITNS